VDWVKTGDLRAEWDYEPACATYSYQADVDMFKGRFVGSDNCAFLGLPL
jgi:hypothetical protein